MDINQFLEKVINGNTGFKSFEKHEIVIHPKGREFALAEFIIRCLAHKQCNGSQEVLDAIIKQRNES